MKDEEIGTRARGEFIRVRTRQMLHHIFSVLKDEKQYLLPLKEVKPLIKPDKKVYKGIKSVEISRIVGSEGRYAEFNRMFLPRHKGLRSRWINLYQAFVKNEAVPPVKLYELGGVYFVLDGNHRVSVARALGLEYFEAEVILLDYGIDLKPEISAEELKKAVINLENQEFFKKTGLDKSRPEAEIEFTSTGRYHELISHIHSHIEYIGTYKNKNLSFQEGAVSWYDNVFRPVVENIRRENFSSCFPGRSAADFYVWCVRHCHDLDESAIHLSE
ncbi:MAG: transcriptional regulator [Spirochaetota bacterium]